MCVCVGGVGGLWEFGKWFSGVPALCGELPRSMRGTPPLYAGTPIMHPGIPRMARGNCTRAARGSFKLGEGVRWSAGGVSTMKVEVP